MPGGVTADYMDLNASAQRGAMFEAKKAGLGEYGVRAARIIASLALDHSERMPIEWHMMALPLVAPVEKQHYAETFHGMQIASYCAKRTNGGQNV
ncbi:MAG TPA: hypothetical protein PKD20_03160 [Candidatus Saccharibacteria bacterium]|nr:hypothetical protein [Candidatus Saccharibacteria bacterium]